MQRDPAYDAPFDFARIFGSVAFDLRKIRALDVVKTSQNLPPIGYRALAPCTYS
jgi:hypothetical protein